MPRRQAKPKPRRQPICGVSCESFGTSCRLARRLTLTPPHRRQNRNGCDVEHAALRRKEKLPRENSDIHNGFQQLMPHLGSLTHQNAVSMVRAASRATELRMPCEFAG